MSTRVCMHTHGPMRQSGKLLASQIFHFNCSCGRIPQPFSLPGPLCCDLQFLCLALA